MKVSPKLVGHMVSIQLARPVYMTDYKAHVQTKDGRSLLMGEPVVTETAKGPGPVVMDILLGCDVLAVTEDSVTVAMVMGAGGNIVHKTIPSALIACIDEVAAFEAVDLPTVTEHKRAAPAGQSKLIL